MSEGHNLLAAHLIDALHSTGIRLRKIDIINEKLQALVFFRPIHKALAVENVGFYEILQLFCVGCPRENQLLHDVCLCLTFSMQAKYTSWQQTNIAKESISKTIDQTEKRPEMRL